MKHIKIKSLTSIIFFTLIAIPLSLRAETSSRLNVNRPEIQFIQQPSWLTVVNSTYYDGDNDDLVTAGLGFTALSSKIFSTSFANPSQPTSKELRQAKLNRYINTKTGEGSLFGFKRQDLTPLFDGKVAGTEILATINNEDEKVGLLLQIPQDFNKKRPCIIAVPTTDSDGLFNAKDLQIRGLWGLRHNCAVVYNDKGLGNGIYDITNNRGYTIDGKTQTNDLLFEPKVLNRERFIQKYPNRYAIKQLHSRLNSEERWGDFVLKSIEFAFYELNTLFSPSEEVIFNKDNTIVLVYGASDGGGAALKAGELDKDNLIKGIVAVNPQIQPYIENVPVLIKKGNNTEREIEFKSIADYSSYGMLYIPCAVPAIVKNHKDGDVPYADKYLYSQNSCNALKKAQLLTQGTPEEALEKLRQYGWTADMDIQLPYFYYKESIGLPYQYVSAYGHYDLTDRMCSYTVASTQQDPIYYQGKVAPLKEVTFEQLWGQANGHLPIWIGNDSTILALVNNEDLNSPRFDFFSSSEHKKTIDYNSKGAICLYKKLNDPRVKYGISQVTASSNLNGIKTFIVHARNNVKQLPDYTSRSYVALNSQVEGHFSQLRYIEVENTSYLDGNLPFDNTLLSIDYYGEDAIEWLWANLTSGATLPDSQLVHAKAFGGKSGYAKQITENNLIPISQSPKSNDVIKKENGLITLP